MIDKHTITILRCLPGHHAAKTFRKVGSGVEKINFSAGMHFDASDVSAPDIRALGQALKSTANDSRSFAILGRLKQDTAPRGVLRRKQGTGAAFAEIDVDILPIDMDDVPCPVGLSPAEDHEAAITCAIEHLPPYLQQATCWWQFTSSAGVYDWSNIRLRLWFALDRKWSCEDLRAWARVVNKEAGRKLIDPAVFQGVQPIYIANPQFDGLEDPVPQRWGLREGASDIATLQFQPETPAYEKSQYGLQRGVGFDSYLSAVGTEEGFHEPLRGAVASYVSTHGRNGTDIEALKQSLRETINVADPGGRDAATMRRYLSDQYLDDLIKGALQKFGSRQPRLTLDTSPYYQTAPLPKAAAQLQLEKEIQHWLDKGGTTIIRAPAGLGKSRTLVSALDRWWKEDHFGPLIHYYVPTVKLARELAPFFVSAQTTVIRGRLNEEDGEPLCRKPEVIKATVRAGLPVQQTVCHYYDKEKDESIDCQYYKDCPYQAQFKDPADICFFAHDYLTLPKREIHSKPDLVIIDEGFLKSILGVNSFAVEQLPKDSALTRLVLKTLDTGLLAPMRAAFKNKAALLKAAQDLEGERPDIHPAMPSELQIAKLREYRKKRPWQLPACLRALHEEFDLRDRDQCHSLKLRRDVPIRVHDGGHEEHRVEDRVYIHRRKALKLPKDVPILHIDASADELILQVLFPELRYVEIATERNADVVQVHSTRLSKASLTMDRSAEERIHAINKILLREAQRASRGLVVIYKDVEPFLTIPDGWESAHFGNIRGLDRWKDCETVVIVGRQQMSQHDAEGLARCLWVDSYEPLNLSGELTEEVRGYRLREGFAGVRVPVHPDPRVQRVIELHRERESEQAIDRIRLIHNDRTKRVLLLSNIPLDVTVNRLMSWSDAVQGGTRLEQAMESLGGVLPLRADFLCREFPALWRSARAAEGDIHGAFKNPETSNKERVNPETPNNIYIRTSGVLNSARLYSYRIQGQRRPTRALSYLATGTTRTRLETILGQPLVAFDELSPAEPIMTLAKMYEADAGAGFEDFDAEAEDDYPCEGETFHDFTDCQSDRDSRALFAFYSRDNRRVPAFNASANDHVTH